MASASRCHRLLLTFVALIVPLLLGTAIAFGQDTSTDEATVAPQGAVLTGRVEPGDAGGVVYRLRDLPAGATLYAYARAQSGNLDPVIYLMEDEADIVATGEQIYAVTRAASARGEDPFIEFADIADEMTLRWDDDSGEGYDAAFSWEIPAAGDYLLAVASIAFVDTTGDYELLLGINTPQVAQGSRPNVSGLATETAQSAVVRATQEVTGTLSLTEPQQMLQLVDLREGDTFVAAARAISGTLVPALILEDFGGKPVAANNIQGAQPEAVLRYTFTEPPSGYRLVIEAAAPNGQQTEGDFRLRLSRNVDNAAEDVTGAFGPPIVNAPIPVTVSLRIDQITDVDQQAENFSIVASSQIEWQDPALAFSPASCQCDRKVLRSERVITDYLTKNNINVWPAGYIYNQQGGRSTQSQLLAIEPDGSAIYFERFTTTLQAPDFNFRQFPFDEQLFHVRHQLIFEDDYFVLHPDETRSGFGEQLGEEEWIFSNDEFTTNVIKVDNRDQAVFSFTTHRHLDYYIFRILVPVLLIILVSWITFFLRDYGRRIEVTSGNLLLFIAYNFTIANDLPRLGYLTFLDFVLISTFIISAVVIIINVWFRRLEANGEAERAARWDAILIWVYPLLYLVGGFVVYLWFFQPWTGQANMLAGLISIDWQIANFLLY
jgi:hypothetical protein